MALTFGLTVLAIIAASIASNHYGYFGDTGQFEFYNGRPEKVKFLSKLSAPETPDAYLIGSSNMLPFQTEQINNLFPVENTFNLGSYWGRAEDIWVWSNFVLQDLEVKPKMVIIGVEPWTFTTDNRGPPLYSNYRRRLLATPALVRHLPDYSALRLRATEVLDSLTFQSMRLMLRMSLQHNFSHVRLPPFYSPKGVVDQSNPMPMLAPRSPFDLDGSSRGLSMLEVEEFLPEELYALYETEIANMKIPEGITTQSPERQDAVATSHVRLDEVVNFLPGDAMDPDDVELFDRTLKLLHENNVQVGIVMLPMHPYFFDLLQTHTRHAEHLDFLRARLEQWQATYPNIQGVVDASHIARFGGDPRAFHDNYHMTPANTRRVVTELKKVWGK